MRSNQGGFTLVELVVVIVILGILAATAFPRFINLTSDARSAAAAGMAGGLRSAVTLVQARYQATGNFTATTVTMADGTTVAVGTGATGGFPTAALAEFSVSSPWAGLGEGGGRLVRFMIPADLPEMAE